MSFRKKQFQFADIDPSERREEILKRFGFKPEEDKGMFFESTPIRQGWPEWESLLPRTGHFEEPHWRTRPSSGSAPGSPRMGMGMPNMKWNNEENIPIKVVHENAHKSSQNCDDTTDSETSSQGSGQNIRTQKKPYEPRIHHIPIKVEPREGSTSSGYASDGGPDEFMKSPNRDVSQNGVSNTQNLETQDKPGVQQVRQHCFESNWPNSPLSQPGEQNHKSKVHHIPITLETGGEALHTGVNPLNRQCPSPTHSNVLRSSSGPPSSLPDQFSPTRPTVMRSASGPYSSQESSGFRTNPHHSNTIPQQSQKGKSPNGPYVSKMSVNKTAKQQHATPAGTSNQQQKISLDPIQQVSSIRSEVKELRTKVEAFVGTSQDKIYRYLDEMLTRCLLRLDDIDTGGKEEVRLARKAAIKEVQSCLSTLESKAGTSPSSSQNQEIASVESDNQPTCDMEEKLSSQCLTDEQQLSDKMEVDFPENQQASKKVSVDENSEEHVSKKMAVEDKPNHNSVQENTQVSNKMEVDASESSQLPAKVFSVVQDDGSSNNSPRVKSEVSRTVEELQDNQATSGQSIQESEETCDQMTKL